MSIGTFISSAIDNLNKNRYDVALALVCSAVDATASTQYPEIKENNKRYKKFLKNNMRIITTYGFPGITASGISIKCHNIPDIKADSEGHTDIENILYHIIRCSLIHQCEIDQRIDFVPYTHIGDFEDKFRIPDSLVFGLLLSVVLAECNKQEKLDKDYVLNLNEKSLSINKIWGNFKNFNI
ncbi:MAG: hypothetical protein ACL93V_16675 [Candidatus Electrothrix sp. YB6]